MTTRSPGCGPVIPSGEQPDSGYSHTEERSTRLSRWTSIIYLVIALATPVLLYSGPDVMSPATPAFANAAIDGRLTLHRLAPCTPASSCPSTSLAATPR